MTCGGCQGLGAHTRWCREVVGYLPSVLGPLSEHIENAGDLIGSNDTGLANRLYRVAGELAEYAKTRSTPTQRATWTTAALTEETT